MLTPQIKNKIKECLAKRHWRNLDELFKPPYRESLLNLCTQEPELKIDGLGLELILERVNVAHLSQVRHNYMMGNKRNR